MIQFENKVAAVTGAASGIGAALCCELAKAGCNIAAADKDVSGLHSTKDQVEAWGVQCSIHELDVSDRVAVEAFAADVVAKHGKVNLIFNNAGVTLADQVETLDLEDFEWVMKVNFWGVVYGTRAFLPYLRAAGDAHIINVSSIFGSMGVPMQATYNASKFAVRGFTEALKMELIDSDIGVSCVQPGGVKTAIARNARIGKAVSGVTSSQIDADFQKLARTTPERAAKLILRGVRKKRRRILIGADARIMDWIVRLFPGTYEKILRLESEMRQKAAERSSTSS